MCPCRNVSRLAFLTLLTLASSIAVPSAWAQDNPPVVTAPATVQKPEGCVIDFTVTAATIPGESIVSLTASGLPAGATFTADASNTSGTFHWATGFTSAGSYTVTFQAIDSRSLQGTANTSISVTSSARGPVVTAPASAFVNEGQCLTFVVTAADPDGDPINCFSPSPVVPFGSFTTNAARTSGTFTWCPTYTQAGTYSVTFQACSDICGGTNCDICGSATTVITVNTSDPAPVVTAPATVNGQEGVLLTFTVSAATPDGSTITSLTAAPLPVGAIFGTNASHTSGTFSWTPSFSQQGTYSVTFTATNGLGLTGTATTTINVGQSLRPPVVSAPSNVSVNEGSPLTFTVTASDPDGDPITSLTAAGSAIDAGGAFASNAAHTSGTFSWTPSFTQSGTYGVTFTASNALSGTAMTTIDVIGESPRPVVIAPATISRPQACVVEFTVSASEPSGTPISSLTAAPLPSGATFTVNAANTSGTFQWAPSSAQVGTFTVTFTAVAGGVAGTAQTSITITQSARGPVVTAPTSLTVNAGQCLTFVVSAVDPDGDPINCLTPSPVIPFATFAKNAANTSGTFTWCPTQSDVGTYTITFTACSDICGGPNCDICGSATVAITVLGACSPPVADAGGPYTGVVGAPICFDGTGSSDPTGGALTYQWDFGDGSTGTGAMICHTYTVSGVYNVTLTVTGPCGTDTDVTTVTFQQFCATAFTRGGNKSLRLSSGKPTWCAQIEPVGGCYENSSVIPGSIVMRFSGGAVTEIHALSDKTAVGGDTNGNGIDEITACFAKEDLRQLFSGLPSGQNDVTVTIAMNLVGGGTVQAQLTIRVVASGPALAASVVPNPMNPEAVLVFTTPRAGAAKAAVYDAAGRLVRTLVDDAAYPAGRHDVRFDGRDSRGVPLASGIYFYRVTTAEGSAFGRFAILK